MIKVLDRYILKEFLTIFGGAMVVMVVFYEMVSFIDMAGYFFKFGATLDVIFRYLVFRIPMAFFHVTPVCVLLAATLTMAGMSRFSEIVAMKAAGISLFRICAPIIAASGVISVVAFLDSEYVFHLAVKETTRIYYEEVKKQQRKSVFQRSKVWYKSDDGSVWNIGAVDMDKKTMTDISIFGFDEGSGRIVARVIAASASYSEEGWILRDCVEVRFDGNQGFSEEHIKTMVAPHRAIPLEDLKKTQMDPEEMNMAEISEFIGDMRTKGYDATRYEAEFYGKIAFPFISFIMPFIAVPLSVRSSRSGGFLVGVMIAVLIGITFWFMFSMGLAFGKSGRIPPFLSAFGAHMVFMMAGTYMLTTNRQ